MQRTASCADFPRFPERRLFRYRRLLLCVGLRRSPGVEQPAQAGLNVGDQRFEHWTQRLIAGTDQHPRPSSNPCRKLVPGRCEPARHRRFVNLELGRQRHSGLPPNVAGPKESPIAWAELRERVSHGRAESATAKGAMRKSFGPRRDPDSLQRLDIDDPIPFPALRDRVSEGKRSNPPLQAPASAVLRDSRPFVFVGRDKDMHAHLLQHLRKFAGRESQPPERRADPRHQLMLENPNRVRTPTTQRHREQQVRRNDSLQELGPALHRRVRQRGPQLLRPRLGRDDQLGMRTAGSVDKRLEHIAGDVFEGESGTFCQRLRQGFGRVHHGSRCAIASHDLVTSPCPDADTLVALAEGRIPVDESRALSEHVAECSLCGLLLAELDASSSTSAPTVDAVVEELSDTALGVSLEAGEMAGRYRVLRVIGQGAMGVVYEAEDPKLDRRVAVKALKVSPTDAVAGAMLREEGRSLGQLQHPHVVPVFDVGTCRLGWFIAMEFVDGEPLDAWCKTQPWTAIVDRFAEAAEGVAAAHRVGIVHRDFKPSNVLVGTDNRARVADFGIAVTSSAQAPSHTLEGSASVPAPGSAGATGAVIGTPVYMAPEQLTGQPATPASDQYAFFVSLFEMLQGSRPFSGSTPRALLRARESGPEPLTRNDVPAKLEKLITKGLCFDPEQRHLSMSAVAAALRAVLAPTPKRWRWAVAGGLTVGAAVALVPSSEPSSRCEAPATAFESAWQGEQRPALRARWEGVLPVEAFRRVDRRLDRFARRWATEFAATCAQERSAAAGVQGCLRRNATRFNAALEVSLQEDTPASKVMDVLIGGTPGLNCTQSTVRGGTSLSTLAGSGVIDGWNARSQALYSADQYGECTAFLLDRWDAIERFGTPEQRAHARFIRGLAELLPDPHSGGFALLTEGYALATSAGADELVADIALAALAWSPLADPAAAETWTQRARADVERAGNPRLSVRFYVAVGSSENRRGHFERATEAAEAAESILRGLEADTDLAWTVASLRGNIEQGRRNYDVALVHFDSALDLIEQGRGPGSLLSLGPRTGLIQALLGVGDLESAADLLAEQAALLDASELRGAAQRGTVSMLRTTYFESIGDLESAIFESRTRAERTSPTERQWSGIHTRLGLALLRSRDYAGARDVFVRIQVHQEAKLGSESQLLSITLHNLAEAESGLGQLDRAAGHYREALSIADHSEGESPVQAYALTGLGEVELRRGELELAREHLTRALTISHDDEAERGETQFSLARTLWALGGPVFRAQALELADQAAAALDDTPGYEQTALELSRWRETL